MESQSVFQAKTEAKMFSIELGPRQREGDPHVFYRGPQLVLHTTTDADGRAATHPPRSPSLEEDIDVDSGF